MLRSAYPALVLILAFTTGCLNPSASENATPAESSELFSPSSITDFHLRGTKKIVLTFDDGPGAGTSEILTILKAYNIRATFFVLGRQAQAQPALMQRIARDGHIVANHSYSHQNLAERRYSNPSALLGDLMSVHKAIAPYQNPNFGKYFRAPYGAWRAPHAAALNANPALSAYVGPIFWDIGGQMGGGFAADWACWSRGIAVKVCLHGYLNETIAKQGGVVLFHDINAKSAAMLREYIPTVLKMGFSFANLDDVNSLSRYR